MTPLLVQGCQGTTIVAAYLQAGAEVVAIAFQATRRESESTMLLALLVPLTQFS